MKKGNLAASVATKNKEASELQKKAKQDQNNSKSMQQKQFDNYEIAIQIMKAKRKNEDAFPSKDIESLVELAYKVVAANFDLYPDLNGVEDKLVQEEVSLTSIVTTLI